MLLTVDLCQLDGHIRNPRQRSTPEKIRGGIVPAQQCFVLRRDNRCELLQITNHQKLNPSERTGITPVFPQCVVDSVQKVGAHHWDFINHQQVERPDNPQFVLWEIEFVTILRTRHIGRQRQLEEWVNGNTACIDCRNTRRGYHNHCLCTLRPQGSQEGGLPCSSLACKENAYTCMLGIFPCQLQLPVVVSVTIVIHSDLLKKRFPKSNASGKRVKIICLAIACICQHHGRTPASWQEGYWSKVISSNPAISNSSSL